ncbi:MAG: carboxymuconolactone decarboxylase family protein [Thermoleophilaceae bacterium]
MARLPYVTPESAPPGVRERLERAPDLNIFKLVAHAETAFAPWLRFGAVLLRDLALPARLRELAILRVAALTPGAQYEWVQHEPIATEAGATAAEIEAARTGAPLDGDAGLLLRFTEEVVREASPSDETFEAAAERFTPRELVELLLVIGQYMTLARVMATARIDLDAPTGLSPLVDGR